VLQPPVVVDLNAVNIQDENVRYSSVVMQTLGTLLSDRDVGSSEDDVVQPPQSRVIMAEPQPVKSTEVTSEKNIAALGVVKSSSKVKQCKRRASSSHPYQPRSKRLRHNQKSKRATTGAVWAESLFVSESSEVGRDAAGVVSAVDTKELSSVPLSDAAAIVGSAPLVSEAGQFQIMTLKKYPDTNSVDSAKLPLKVIPEISSNSTGLTSKAAAAGQTLIQRDAVGGTVTVDDATEGLRSSNATSSSVAAQLLKSPPAVQRTLLTDIYDSTRESSPSTSIPILRTTLPLWSSPCSGSKTVFIAPVHTSSGNITSTSVYRVSPASDLSQVLTAASGQSFSVRAVGSTTPRQCHSGGASVSALSHVHLHSSQSTPSVGSDLRPTTTLAIRVHPPVTVSSLHHCSASAVAVQRFASPAIAGNTSSQSTRLTSPRSLSTQPIRIRINAADLGNIADPTAVMNHVRGILSRTNTMLPGAQIRIRYLPPPPTTVSQTPATRFNCPPQTTTTEQKSRRVSQLDGTADSDSESEAAAVKQSENTSPHSTDNVRTVYSKRRSKAADADEMKILHQTHASGNKDITFLSQFVC